MQKTSTEVEALLKEQNLNRLSDETAESVIVKEGNTLEPGAEYTFDILDENGKIVAGEKPYGNGVVRYLACTKNGHACTIIASQLYRVAYPTDKADAKIEAVCTTADALRKAFRGLTFDEILGSEALIGKTVKVTGTRPMFVRKDREKPFGPDNAEARTYPVFDLI